MSGEQIIGISVTLIVMLIGLVGSVVPVLPGTPVVLIAAIGHRLYFGEASVSNGFLAVLVLLTGLSLLLDFLASMLGAKKFGATWRGMVGAVIGGVIGLFFSLPGIILGPFLGAMALEMTGGKEFKIAAKAGAGAVVGLLLGVVGKFSICVMMIALFATNTIYRTLNQPGPATGQLAQAQTSLGAEWHFRAREGNEFNSIGQAARCGWSNPLIRPQAHSYHPMFLRSPEVLDGKWSG